MRRWIETVATGSLLVLAAVPFVVLFPEPPAFGRSAVATVATVAILAAVGITVRAAPSRRARMLRRALVLLLVSALATILRILLAPDIPATVPTADILPRLFGLEGEDVDDAVLYEVWLELWLGSALAATVAFGFWRAVVRRHVTRPVPSPWNAEASAPAAEPWNLATVLLWLVGWAVLAGAMVDGHRTAAFLRQAIHVTGTIADPQSHPRIRFATIDGTVVEFTQNGAVSRALGASVPVAYLPADPAGSAQADTVWADWGDVLGLLWIGLGFTVFPFFGLRATFRAGRW